MCTHTHTSVHHTCAHTVHITHAHSVYTHTHHTPNVYVDIQCTYVSTTHMHTAIATVYVHTSISHTILISWELNGLPKAILIPPLYKSSIAKNNNHSLVYIAMR